MSSTERKPAIALVPVDERVLLLARHAAGLHLADVDRVVAGVVARMDAAIEPGEGVRQHRCTGCPLFPGPLLEAILVLHPGEAVGQLRLVLGQEVHREHRSRPLKQRRRLVPLIDDHRHQRRLRRNRGEGGHGQAVDLVAAAQGDDGDAGWKVAQGGTVLLGGDGHGAGILPQLANRLTPGGAAVHVGQLSSDPTRDVMGGEAGRAHRQSGAPGAPAPKRPEPRLPQRTRRRRRSTARGHPPLPARPPPAAWRRRQPHGPTPRGSSSVPPDAMRSGTARIEPAAKISPLSAGGEWWTTCAGASPAPPNTCSMALGKRRWRCGQTSSTMKRRESRLGGQSPLASSTMAGEPARGRGGPAGSWRGKGAAITSISRSPLFGRPARISSPRRLASIRVNATTLATRATARPSQRASRWASRCASHLQGKGRRAAAANHRSLSTFWARRTTGTPCSAAAAA